MDMRKLLKAISVRLFKRRTEQKSQPPLQQDPIDEPPIYRSFESRSVVAIPPRYYESAPPQLPPPPPSPPPPLPPLPDRAGDKQRWRDDIRYSQVSIYVMDGHGTLQQHDVDQLSSATKRYLDTWGDIYDIEGTHRNALLLELIEGQEGIRDKVIASLSCVSFLTKEAAFDQLASFITLNPAVYLRCLAVTRMSKANLFGNDEWNAIHYITQIDTQTNIHVEQVQAFLDTFIPCSPSLFLPDHLVLQWIERRGIGRTLIDEADTYLGFRRLSLALQHIQCIKMINSLHGGPELFSTWSQTIAHWPAWLCWTPNPKRLSQWESGRFTPGQKRQLSKLTDLDGPDTATLRAPTLLHSGCFDHLDVEPRSTALLEQMLTLLSKAELIGPNAVGLFIHLFIDNPATRPGFTFFEHALNQLGSDESHGRVATILGPQYNNLDICARMDSLSELLPLLKVVTLPTGIGDTAALIVEVLTTAQREFVAQLERGPAEYIGMRVLILGEAIMGSPSVHSILPHDFVEMVRKFPKRHLAESIFDRLEAAALQMTGRFSGLKTYLTLHLGGGMGLVMPLADQTDIQNEVGFWDSRPDEDRQNLASVLSSLEFLDYSTYTSCLVSITYEKDFFVQELSWKLMDDTAGACVSLSGYLALRRSHNQLTENCWTLLLFAFIEERWSFLDQGNSHLRTMDEWLGFIRDLLLFDGPAIQARLRASGPGITRQRIGWWRTLSGYDKTLRQLSALVKGLEDVGWIYLSDNVQAVLSLLDHVKKGKEMPALGRIIPLVISQLNPNGANLMIINEILQSLRTLSPRGEAIYRSILTRAAGGPGQTPWAISSVVAICKVWLDSPLLTDSDKVVLNMETKVYGTLLSPSRKPASSLLSQLIQEHDSIIERARELEASRWKLKHKNSQAHSALMRDAGIRDAVRRPSGDAITAELFDVVEELAPGEYELSFPLTGLKDLQRQVRGVPEGARLLLVQVNLNNPYGFCLHYSPNDESTARAHKYWKGTSGDPDRPICSVKPSLFTYHIARHLHRFLKTRPSLAKIHKSVESWITKSPSACGVCGTSVSVNLWKTPSCSPPCSVRLRQAPLEVRLHNLLVDPLAMDLLLSSVYAAAVDVSNLDLIPGCPVAKASIPTIINSLPPMVTLAKTSNLSQLFRNDPNGVDQERLLSWLCLAFRGFLRSAPTGYVIPSMPQSQQFLLMNSHPEGEKAFASHLVNSAASGPVFHGTSMNRLFLILTTGIKNVSNTQFRANGAASGPGIYCGDEQTTSWPYARPIGNNWKNSALDPQMRLMLGLELANYPTVNVHTHVVQDDTRVLVRYVFLLPANYQSSAPPRRHVEPAMTTAFANLRNGRGTYVKGT